MKKLIKVFSFMMVFVFVMSVAVYAQNKSDNELKQPCQDMINDDNPVQDLFSAVLSCELGEDEEEFASAETEAGTALLEIGLIDIANIPGNGDITLTTPIGNNGGDDGGVIIITTDDFTASKGNTDGFSTINRKLANPAPCGNVTINGVVISIGDSVECDKVESDITLNDNNVAAPKPDIDTPCAPGTSDCDKVDSSGLDVNDTVVLFNDDTPCAPGTSDCDKVKTNVDVIDTHVAVDDSNGGPCAPGASVGSANCNKGNTNTIASIDRELYFPSVDSKGLKNLSNRLNIQKNKLELRSVLPRSSNSLSKPTLGSNKSGNALGKFAN